MICQFCTQAYLEPSGEEHCCKGCKEHGACEKCGLKPAGSDMNEFLCDECAHVWLDNYEPPDPDLSGPTRQEMDAHIGEQRARERGR